MDDSEEQNDANMPDVKRKTDESEDESVRSDGARDRYLSKIK